MSAKQKAVIQPTPKVLLEFLEKWHLNDTPSCRLH
jgi:hypothetical protein